MVDVDASLGQQLLDVAVGQAKRRYQRTATTMTLGGRRKPAKAHRGSGAARGRRVLTPAVSPLEHGHSQPNSPRDLFLGRRPPVDVSPPAVDRFRQGTARPELHVV
jgi:hypothetical protein